MASQIINPALSIRGAVPVPGDKSISHRALILSSLAEGSSTIRNLLLAEDVLCTMRVLQQLGVHMSHKPEEIKEGDELKIFGEGFNSLKAPKGNLDCGNSGTTLRLMLGLLSAQPFDSLLIGDASLDRRPVERVTKPLEKMGGFFGISFKNTKRFVKVGRIRPPPGGLIHTLPIASAQVKSAILLSALHASGPTTLTEPAPSRDHTERMMNTMGVQFIYEENKITINPPAKLKPLNMTIPGDFSSASFFIVAGLILPNSEVIIPSVGLNSTRSALLRVLREMGGSIQLNDKRSEQGELIARVTSRSSSLKGITVSGELIPNLIDEIPIFSVAAASAEGVSRVTDAEELRVKESDRIKTMSAELQKMGIPITEKEDGFVMTGGSPFRAGTFMSHGDHRVAMSLSIAALKGDGASTIEDTDCVRTSFPQFYDLLKRIVK